MLPAPLVVLLRCFVVWACGWAAGHGWTFFSLDSSGTDALVQVAAGAVAIVVTGGGALAARVASRLNRLLDRHPAALLDAAAAVPGVAKIEATEALAGATASKLVVAAAPPGGA